MLSSRGIENRERDLRSFEIFIIKIWNETIISLFKNVRK